MKLNTKRTFFIGLAFLSISAFWQMYDNIIPLILQNTFGFKETATGAIMAIDNVLAVFLLPIIGIFSDRINTKLGKRTPFIIVGTIFSIIFMMLLPYSDTTVNSTLFIISLAVTLISMAMYRSPAVALMPDLTPKPLRSKANAIINLMGAGGGIITLLLIAVLVPKTENPNYFYVFLGVAILMIVSLIVLLITISENKIAKQIAIEYPEENDVIENYDKGKHSNTKLPNDVKKSLILILISIFLWFTAYNAVTTAFSRYATQVWGLQGGSFANCLLVATGAAILSYIPIGIISSYIGRKKSILIGIVLMFICYSLAFFYTDFHITINILFALIGVGWATISVNSLPMVVEMSKQSDLGKYTGLYYTFSMAAQIFTPIFSGFLLQNISYKILFPYASFFTVIAFITMFLVKHGDSKPLAKKSLVENYYI